MQLLIILTIGARLAIASTAVPAKFLEVKPDNRCTNHREVATGRLLRGPRPTNDWAAKISDGSTPLNVVDLEGSKEYSNELQLFASLGIKAKFNSVPMANMGMPESDEDSAVQALALLANRGKSTTFVHCHYGQDRTGFVLALYRVIYECWSEKDARDEWFHTQGLLHAAFQMSKTNYFHRLVRDPAALANFKTRVESARSARASGSHRSVSASGKSAAPLHIIESPLQAQIDLDRADLKGL